MRCTGWVYSAAPTCDSAPPPVSPGRGAVGRSVAGALGLAGPLRLEVGDGLLDLGLVLRLAGFLDHLGGDGGRCELLEHACHVWPPRGRLRTGVPVLTTSQPSLGFRTDVDQPAEAPKRRRSSA